MVAHPLQPHLRLCGVVGVDVGGDAFGVIVASGAVESRRAGPAPERGLVLVLHVNVQSMFGVLSGSGSSVGSRFIQVVWRGRRAAP